MNEHLDSLQCSFNMGFQYPNMNDYLQCSFNASSGLEQPIRYYVYEQPEQNGFVREIMSYNKGNNPNVGEVVCMNTKG